jgi:hypothetical protein
VATLNYWKRRARWHHDTVTQWRKSHDTC